MCYPSSKIEIKSNLSASNVGVFAVFLLCDIILNLLYLDVALMTGIYDLFMAISKSFFFIKENLIKCMI